MADYADYLRAQEAVSRAWSDRMHWNRMSLLNTARTGFFSSDRSIGEYCKNIWAVDPLSTWRSPATCAEKSHKKALDPVQGFEPRCSASAPIGQIRGLMQQAIEP